MYFITLENIKSRDNNKWDIFDQYCNELAEDVSDVSEQVEVNLLLGLMKMKDQDPDMLIFLGTWFLLLQFPSIL